MTRERALRIVRAPFFYLIFFLLLVVASVDMWMEERSSDRETKT